MLRVPISMRPIGMCFPLLLGVMNTDCSRTPRTFPSTSAIPAVAVFEETFDDPESVQRNWSAVVPEVSGAAVLLEDGSVRMALPSSSEIKLLHLIDVTEVRGKRVRISARIRCDAAGADAHIAMAFGGSAAGFRSRARTSAASSSWTTMSAVVDVDPNALRAELSLVLHGRGKAWFDDVRLELITPATSSSKEPLTVLTAQQLTGVQALARAVALVRYRHPSDQAAGLDWDAFFPVAIDSVMQTQDANALLRVLRELFVQIAPTVEFSSTSRYSIAEASHRPSDHLARWRHEGLGPNAGYKSWREGRDADQAQMSVDMAVNLTSPSRCGKSRLRATVRNLGAEGEVLAYAEVEQAGDALKRFDRKVAHNDSTANVDFEMPADAYRVRLGVELRGRSAAVVEALSLSCANGDTTYVDMRQGPWEYRGATDLYSYTSHECGGRHCLTVNRRTPDNIFQVERDVMNVEIANHLWIHVPLAVWSDGVRTLPETNSWEPPNSGVTTDTAEHLATLASAWGTLSIFYPGFRDQNIDWLQELPKALATAAAARSVADTYRALSRLMAKIRDAHAGAMHGEFPVDGLLPLRLRRFGDAIVVVGGLDEYLKALPIGTEVIAVDRVPILQAYDELRERVSASTPGWADWAIPSRLIRGPQGAFSTVRAKTADGREGDFLLPHLSREFYDSFIREPRPAFGAELATGIYYIDLEAMSASRWQTELPILASAQAIILDMRGYPSNAAFTMLGHFIDGPIRSPNWQTPILETGTYQTSYWTINPKTPRLRAKLVVLLDGRAASAAETLLQMIHDNNLAVLVGETSAGTNGTPNVVSLPGGFSMRFTGERVPLLDGTALQGHGIVPDEIAHQTLDAVLAGRDAILEAGLARARTLIGN